MTSKEDVIRMAREAGFVSAEYWPDDFKGLASCVERFAELVRADEREACALVCEELFADVPPYSAPDCAAAIRARGDK
jgi:hypothetical protein